MPDDAPSIQERILLAARDLFLTKGYNGSNLRDIAREASVSMGGIYHHFGSKEEIYLALLNSSATPEALTKIGSLFSDTAFPANLGAIGAAIFEVAKAHRDYFKLMYIDVLEFQGKNARPIIGRFRDSFHTVSAGLLKNSIESGRLNGEVHPAVIARAMFDLFLFSALEEVMLDTSLARTLGVGDKELAEEMAKVLLYGIMARSE